MGGWARICTITAATPANMQAGSKIAIDLGTLGGAHGYANAINATGQIVGMGYTSGNL